jgi:superoxide dismutase, Fe-Mn family
MNTNPTSLDRRSLLTGALAAAATASIAPSALAQERTPTATPARPTSPQTRTQGKFQLMELPYPENALEPLISARTIFFHHGKHHKGYLDRMNAAIEGNEHANRSLEEIIRRSHAGADQNSRNLFNNAAQVWNHDFYWKSMSPDGGGKPEGKLLEAIERDFGSFHAFTEQFAKTAIDQFASGWGWLVQGDGGKLEVMSTSNADLPMVHGKKALLTIDVWEHAYYLDLQNMRADHVHQWIEKLANWEFAAQNLG